MNQMYSYLFTKFGNKTIIKESPETIEKGFAGKIASVFDSVTPSKVKIDVIGSSKLDYAIQVYLDDLEVSLWIAPELLDIIENGTDSDITWDNNQKDIQWDEFTKPTKNKVIVDEALTNNKSNSNVKWWKFW